jgi:hypothetical protein
MSDIIFPVTSAPGICQDCKHLAPRLRRYGKVTICHACTVSRQRVERGDEPQAHRPKDPYEQPLRDRRCSDCKTREPDGRNYGDAYLCLTCECETLERVGVTPDRVDYDRIPA